MIVFYSDNMDQSSGILDKDEARHCVKALRKRIGDSIKVFDGKGAGYECLIKEINRHEVHFDVKRTEVCELIPYLPRIGISLLKNTSRFEWFLEKAVEIGVHSVHPLICNRTEKSSLKMERSKGIMISAMKQSLRAFLPRLYEPVSFHEFVDGVSTKDRNFICHYEENNPHLYDALSSEEACTLLIGPEGDFSDDEMKRAREQGFIDVNISSTRLRAETAGIVALDIVALRSRSWNSSTLK